MPSVYKRGPVWYARLAGGKRVSTGAKSQREAFQKLKELEEQELLGTSSASDLRLMVAAERFFRERRLKPKTIYLYERALDQFFAKLGDFPLKTLDRNGVKHYVEVRLNETSSIMVRRELAFISSLYSAAQHWEGGPEGNPARTYGRRGLQDAKRREGHMTAPEIDRLLAACNHAYQRLFIMLAVDTGMRSGEIMTLTWEEITLQQVRLEDGTLQLQGKILLRGEERTKTGGLRHIPLSPRLLDTLNGTPIDTRHSYVLKSPRGGGALTTFKTSWAGICKRAKVSGFRIHDLRHTFASWSNRKGVTTLSIQHLLGHKTASMAGRYAHPSDESLEEAIKKLTDGTPNGTGATVSVPSTNLGDKNN